MHDDIIRARLRDWIARANGGLSAGALRDDTPIFETGILTSLDVVELILLLEELRGAEIDVEHLDPAALRSIDSMCRTYLAAGNDDAG